MVYENVERVRKARGVTKTHLAKELHMSLQGYRHIASGSVRLDAERLKVLAMALSVSPEVLLDDSLTDSVIEQVNNTA